MGDEEVVEEETEMCGNDTCVADECDCCGDCEQTNSGCTCCKECGALEGDCDMCSYCGDEHAGSWSDYCSYCEDHMCSECGDTDCDCGSGMGNMTATPWEKRGVQVSARTYDEDWETVWKILHKEIDVVTCAADFYLLEALSSGVLFNSRDIEPFRLNPADDVAFFDAMEIPESEQQQFLEARAAYFDEKEKEDVRFHISRLMGEAEIRLEALVDKIDESLLNYGQMAVAGELRHHQAVGGSVLANNERANAWCGWPKVYEAVGPQSLLDAAELFRDFDRSGYGGEAWAVCAEVVYARVVGSLGPDGPEGKINRRLFCDRVWTLQHNGGSFLNKISWKIGNKKGWGVNYMQQILDAHASDPPNVGVLLSVASDRVVALHKTMKKAVNRMKTGESEESDILTMSFTAKTYWSGVEEPISIISAPETFNKNYYDETSPDYDPTQFKKIVHLKRFGKNVSDRGQLNLAEVKFTVCDSDGVVCWATSWSINPWNPVVIRPNQLLIQAMKEGDL